MKKIILIFFVLLMLPLHSLEAGDYDYRVRFKDKDGGTIATTEVNYDGLVPCGRCFNLGASTNSKILTGSGHSRITYLSMQHCVDDQKGHIYIPCDICHLFITFENIITLVLRDVIPAIALLVIVISGFLFYSQAGKPDMVNTAKKTFTGAIIGLAISYSAWIITLSFLSFIWTDDSSWERWWTDGLIYTCEVEMEDWDEDIDFN